jgi:GDP-L-fucose synthase
MTLYRDSKIFVAGHRGMVGSAIVRILQQHGYDNLVLRSRDQLDLTEQAAVRNFFKDERPDLVIVAAAKVGGIHANNTYPADFIYENLMIESNLIHQSHKADIDGLLFLGSSCIYPKLAEQPMPESTLLSGSLEPTNEPYAIAKIAGIKLCESYNRQHGRDYRSLMPTNLYGPGDNFDLENSHVIPALMRKFHEAKTNKSPNVEIWGSGNARREFLHVDDLANACLHLLQLTPENYGSATAPMLSHINVGTGEDITIAHLAHLIQAVVDYSGNILFNADRPDGAPRKLLEIKKLKNLGWRPAIGLEQGLKDTYAWYCKHIHKLRQ